MNTLRYISLISILLIAGCKSNPTEPEPPRPVLTYSNFADISVVVTGYDEVTVTHQLGYVLKSNEVAQVYVGIADTSGFHILDTLAFAATAVDEYRTFAFRSVVNLDSSLFSPIIRVRYKLLNNAIEDVDTTARLFQFPYPTAQLAIHMSAFSSTPGSPRAPRDIVRLGEVLYLHPSAAYGLFSYDLKSGQPALLHQYASGDHLAGDSVFVFCDVNHNSIVRYNTSTNQVDLQFPPLFTDNILGMATYNNLLYVEVDNSIMRRYTYNGTLVDSVSFTHSGYYLTIHNGIIYTLDASLRRVLRYDVTTLSSLPPLVAPAAHGEGIKVFNDILYYCDLYKGIICSIPISDLVPAS